MQYSQENIFTAFRPSFKKDSNSGVPCRYCGMIKNSFFMENLQWLLPTAAHFKSAGVFVFWFCTFMWFWIWLRTYTNHCTDNSLLSCENTFSLAWIELSHPFDFRRCFGKALVAFDLDKKLTQSLAQITMQYHVSDISLPALCSWSISG